MNTQISPVLSAYELRRKQNEVVDKFFNRMQRQAMAINAHDEYIVASRGTGKSEGIDARIILRNVWEMPGSLGGLISPSYAKAWGNTLPAICKALAEWGYIQGIHYVVGHKAPESMGFGKPVRPVLADGWNNAFHFWNGTVMVILSFNQGMSANSMSLDWVIGPEAKFLNYEKIKSEVDPANRGNRQYFGDCPHHHSVSYSTDMPTASMGKWILDKIDEMSLAHINLIRNLYKKVQEYKDMELRLLRYFLTVAKEQSFTKAAEQLHITQPTLSRQMAAFEEELGVTLFIRSGKKISLTEEGILLKRRALEILNLEEKTLEELKGKEDVVEGNITIGCGEFAAVETLAEICKTYKEKYPLVQIVLHTATADAVYEMMNKGLVDIALFMEPVDTEGLDYIRITDCDHWCVGMRPDDPLAEKEFIKKEDLIGKPLILPERVSVQSELANWFGKDYSKLQIAFTSNLGTNAGVMAANGLGYPVSIEGAAKYWREDILVQRRISPEITTSTVIAWRRNIPYSLAVSKMIEEINAFQA